MRQKLKYFFISVFMHKRLALGGLMSVYASMMLFCTAMAQECELGHTRSGTTYGKAGVERYAFIKHGPDGALFLDPYFLPFIENVENQRILDAGCGAAPWAIYAAMHGAFVDGIDIQESMIDKGKEAVIKAGLENQIILEIGSVTHLPYQDASFDKAISINVGCNLPSQNNELGLHLTELARVLKDKGRVIITAPASFGITFTSGRQELQEILMDIEQALIKIDANNPSSIAKHLSSLNNIYRATFINDNGKLKLITNESELINGQMIWRKLPGMIVPNYYHPEKEYINEAIQAGFNIVNIEKPKFNTEIELAEYNENSSEELKIGDAYVDHNAFIIIELEKI